MRSPIAAVRSRARHRGKTPGQLRAECDDLACAVVRLTAENDRLRAALAARSEKEEVVS
ncbi:hypothetical protein [Streptomyces sp. NPDC059788]|uniref:hypothetical protein n=1 Tax=Streptomyces sp. NPDC059788 TaxID=3346948 RepID=UPI00366206D5